MRNRPKLPPLKQGEKRTLRGQYSSGGSTDLTGITIYCQVRNSWYHLVATLSPTITDVVEGRFSIPIDTLTWPAERLLLDIRYVWSGGESVTDTVELRIERAVTESPRS